jgi:hypothetical protein
MCTRAAENLDLTSAKGHVLFDEQVDLVDETTVPGYEERGNVDGDHDPARHDGLT